MRNVIAGIVSAAYLLVNIAPVLAAAPVAEASGLHGKVLVNHGKGFEPATGLVLLNVGDKVMVGEKSSATINYLNVKCTVSATNATVLTVSATAPCKSGTVVASVDNVLVIPAADAHARPLPRPEFPVFPVLLLGGGTIVALVFLTGCNRGVSAC